MVQISGVPLAVSPTQLGQMVMRQGVLPDHLVKSGQQIDLLVLRSGAAGEKVPVQIAGKTLEAILPGPVGAGQQIQMRVVRAAQDGVQLKLVHTQAGLPRMTVPEGAQESLVKMAANRGGQLQVEARMEKGTMQIYIGGQKFDPQTLGMDRIPQPGKWTALLRPAANGMQLHPLGQPDSRALIRETAGQLIIDGSAHDAQAAIGLAEAVRESEQTYKPEGGLGIGPAWIQMPDGTPISIGIPPQQERESGVFSAQLSLHGQRIGTVGILVRSSSAGMQVSLSADSVGQQRLSEASGMLAERLRQITGLPAQVGIKLWQAEQRPVPPGGYSDYG